MATTLVDWLNDGTIPQNKASGAWTPSDFNTGKFRFTLTFAAASTGSPWRPASLTFWGILTTNDANGGCLWLEWNPSGSTHTLIFVAADGSTILGSKVITWGAGANVTITIDQSSATAGASTMTVSGAATGNGTSSGWTRASVYSGTNLYFGAWGGGGFQLPAGSTTTSDIDDAVDGVNGTLAATLGTLTSSAAGVVDVDGVVASTLGAVTSAAAGVVDVNGAASPTLEALASSAAGVVDVNGAVAATLGDVVLDSPGGQLALDATLGAATLVATASMEGGVVDATLDAATLAAAGVVDVGGTVAATLDAATLAADGTAGQEAGGTVDATLGALVLDAPNGQLALDATLAAATLAAESGGLGLDATLAAATLDAPNGQLSTIATLGTLTSSAAGVVDVGGQVAATLGALTLVAGDIGGPTIGDYGAARELFGSAQTSVTVTLDTVNGSTIVVVTGGRLTDLANPPTDNKGNTYDSIVSAEEYANWPGYGIRAWRCLDAVGGANHQITQTFTQFDECTIVAAEVKGAHVVASSAINEVAQGSPLTMGSVTTSGPAALLGFWSGDAPTGQTATITPNGGYEVLDQTTLVDHPNGYVPIALLGRTAQDPGSYTSTISETPDQGAIMVNLALQAAAGLLGTLAGTLGAATVASEGVVDVGGQVAATLGALTSSAAGVVDVNGVVAATLGEATLAADGTAPSESNGTLAATLGEATLTAAGVVDVGGAVAATLGEVSLAAAGSVEASGVLAATLGDVVPDAAGSVEVSGQLGGTLGAATVAAVATVDNPIVVDQVLAELVASAAGVVDVGGQVSATLEGLGATLAGSVEVVGTLAGTLGELGLFATTARPIVGPVSAGLATPSVQGGLVTPSVVAKLVTPS